jgi:hypothetical protein
MSRKVLKPNEGVFGRKKPSCSAREDVVAAVRQPASYAFRNRTAPHRIALQPAIASTIYRKTII